MAPDEIYNTYVDFNGNLELDVNQGAGRPPLSKFFWQCALFFKEFFKCAFLENIKSEIANIFKSIKDVLGWIDD